MVLTDFNGSVSNGYGEVHIGRILVALARRDRLCSAGDVQEGPWCKPPVLL